MKKSLKIALLVALCVAIAATVFVVKKLQVSDTRKTQITSEFISNQISEITELATLHHHYRKVANYQDAKKLLNYMPDWRINKSIKEFSLIYEGDV